MEQMQDNCEWIEDTAPIAHVAQPPTQRLRISMWNSRALTLYPVEAIVEYPVMLLDFVKAFRTCEEEYHWGYDGVVDEFYENKGRTYSVYGEMMELRPIDGEELAQKSAEESSPKE